VRQFWGIADLTLEEVNLWYSSREQAEVGLAKMLRDEPAWVETMKVVRVDFDCPEALGQLHTFPDIHASYN
jgi:hypothetical protein